MASTTITPTNTQPPQLRLHRPYPEDHDRKPLSTSKSSNLVPKPEINALTLFGILFAGSAGGAIVTHLKEDLAGSVTRYLRLGFTLLSILFGTVLAAAGLSYPSKDSANTDISTSGLDIDTDNLTSGDS